MMAIFDYFTYNGVELVNSARAADYPSGWACDSCPTLAEWADGTPKYTTPELDPAPWYDPNIPESARVYGIAGIDVVGLSEVPRADDATTAGISGAIRDIEVTAVICAADACAASYGLAWLARNLTASECSPSCGGAQICLLACCPTGPDDNTGLRQVFGAWCASGPTLTEKRNTPAGVYWSVTWTWRTPNVGIYRAAVSALALTPRDGILTEIDLSAAWEAKAAAVETQRCIPNTACLPVTPPGYPAPPVDPCYPSAAYEGWYGAAAVPVGPLPADLETVVLIEYFAGQATPLHATTVRFWANPLGLDCATVTGGGDPTAALNAARLITDITIPGVPIQGTGTLDGRTGRATGNLTCRDGGTGLLAPVWGPEGGVYTGPSFACATNICVEIFTPRIAGPDAAIRLWFYPRQWAA